MHIPDHLFFVLHDLTLAVICKHVLSWVSGRGAYLLWI